MGSGLGPDERRLFFVARDRQGAEAMAMGRAPGGRLGGGAFGFALLVAFAHGPGGVERRVAVVGELRHRGAPFLHAKDWAIPAFRSVRVARPTTNGQKTGNRRCFGRTQ
jgi:hypothetical protein